MTIQQRLQALEIAKKGSTVPKSERSVKRIQPSFLHAMLQHPSAVLSLSLLTTTLSQFSHEINAQAIHR